MLGSLIFLVIIIFLIASLFLQKNSVSQISFLPNKNINKIAAGLYLTDFENAKDYEYLKQLGVCQILTIGRELPRHGDMFFKTMHIPLDDSPTEDIKKYFNSTYNFINRGSTVVHCAAGISRSVTIVAAYLMRKFKISADKAILHISKCRNIINPNQGFRSQLKQFEKELEPQEN